MLEQKYRIRKKKDIEKIFKKGKNLKQDFLILKSLANNLGFSRFGFIVSQKVSKKASIRNKIKRKLRESIRLKIKPDGKSRDNLFIVLPGLEIRQIESNIEKILKKAKIFSKD